MKPLPRSESAMLIELGFKPEPRPEQKLYAPAIHSGSDWERDQRHIREAASTGQMETRDEVFNNTVGLRSIGERANTKKARWQTVV